MSRFRSVFVCFCLAVVLAVALPATGSASRTSEQASTRATSDSPAENLAGAALSWGQGAWAWLRAIFAEEHGQIMPIVPPPPPPPPPLPPSDLDPVP